MRARAAAARERYSSRESAFFGGSPRGALAWRRFGGDEEGRGGRDQCESMRRLGGGCFDSAGEAFEETSVTVGSQNIVWI